MRTVSGQDYEARALEKAGARQEVMHAGGARLEGRLDKGGPDAKGSILGKLATIPVAA